MIYEKEIPDYAMVPAKEAEERIITPLSKDALYSDMQMTTVSEKPKTLITLEEDVLVPDTKPDLREILLIDGSVNLLTREIERINKGEDYVNLSGDIELQTLYTPENFDTDGAVISVRTRLPFKERWHTEADKGGTITVKCSIEKIEYMVINERKYRVKVSLAVFARENTLRRVEFFDGIKDENIEMLKERIQITNISQKKKDTISICEDLELKEEEPLDSILKQDIFVTENYKQVTGEKIVISGFIHVNLLYSVKKEENSDICDNIKQIRDKIEFTQFIPLKSGEDSSGSRVCFDDGGLRAKIVSDEGGELIRVEGDIVTYVEIYSNITKEIVVDGYHREKDFICDYNTEKGRVLRGTSVGEASVREIISYECPSGEIEKMLYASGTVSEVNNRCEAGKVVSEGILTASMVFRYKENNSEAAEKGVASLKKEIPFRVVTAANDIKGEEIINSDIYIKDLWADKINGRQVEFNASVQVSAEIMEEVSYKVLANPAFEESATKPEKPGMMVYLVNGSENLWMIAKKFKTTRHNIIELNKIEDGEVSEGQKLLIM